jgi:hypothetical protein
MAFDSKADPITEWVIMSHGTEKGFRAGLSKNCPSPVAGLELDFYWFLNTTDMKDFFQKNLPTFSQNAIIRLNHCHSANGTGSPFSVFNQLFNNNFVQIIGYTNFKEYVPERNGNLTNKVTGSYTDTLWGPVRKSNRD